MAAIVERLPNTNSSAAADAARDDARELVVVVGNGPVGFRFVQGLVEREWHRHCRLTVFGEEPRPAYDRVNLTRYLDDPTPEALQYEPRSWYESHDIALHVGDPVVRIDRRQRVVHAKSGRVVAYDRLILATGSRPFMPPVPGIEEDGVYAYRTIADLARIRERALRCRRAVVLGGGLLGLEAAYALVKLNLEVFVVEKASVLMPRQLDNQAAQLLQTLIEHCGVQVIVLRHTERICRTEQGLRVEFAEGDAIDVDMVVVSAGIRPRDELARECGLTVGMRGGIVVDNQLRTDDPHIYAVGECAEHNGTIYGLAAPGFQMAGALVDRLRGGDAQFRGCNQATRLKLMGVNVVFSGSYLDSTGGRSLVWQSPQSYIKLILRNGRVTGLVGVGDVPQFERLQEAIDQKRRVYWWHIQRFEATGRLWDDAAAVSVASWPASAVVCSCRGVTRGCLSEALARGCMTVEALATDTKATTVCGSCLPLVGQLVGGPVAVSTRDPTALATAGVSIIALILVSLLMLARPIALPHSVQVPVTLWQTLILDPVWKQVTGYTLAGAAALSTVLTLRKRTRRLQKVTFSSLRLVHVVVAALALGLLIVHCGYHRGSNLNFVLFSTFVVASLSGAIVGVVAGLEAQLPFPVRSLRRPLTLWHILCLWPLPVLIAFHIVSVYWL